MKPAAWLALASVAALAAVRTSAGLPLPAAALPVLRAGAIRASPPASGVGTPGMVSGTIAEISGAPDVKAPYRHYVMKFHVTGMEDGAGQAVGSGEAVVCILAMHNRKVLPVARLKVGERLSVRLTPWTQAEKRYGRIQSGTLATAQLEIEKPMFWGETPGQPEVSAEELAKVGEEDAPEEQAEADAAAAVADGTAELKSQDAAPARAGFRDVPHPFMLWTQEEAAAIRKSVETDATAKEQYARMLARDGSGGGKGAPGYPPFLNLFKYGVMGDAQAGEAEKNALLGFFGKRPPESVPGNPASGNAPYRDDHWLDGLRFDVLYDLLTDEQRKQYRDTVENYMQWFRTKYGPWRRCPEQGIPRTGWLPNMQYPTVAGIHAMVAATKDEKLIREVFESPGGLKWWLDVYVADGGFYMEEFGKYGSMTGAQLLWCEAMERLGVPQYGYGYVGQPQNKPGYAGGGTMLGFLSSLIRAGYPRVERGASMPDYPCVNMGDAGSQSVVRGVNADGSGGTAWWYTANMWGAMKMMHPFWWEFGHRRFPDAGFDYFLAQMRKPGEEMYLPSLYLGLGSIDPKKVKAPPAPSYVAPERGLALLRAEEGPGYWESPKPAVGFQFGSYYVHYVHDCFSILQFVADNRFVYNKMGYIWGGYAGGDPVRDSVRGQGSGVTVDSLQIQPVDTGDAGSRNQRIRSRMGTLGKYAAVRAKPAAADDPAATNKMARRAVALYPDVDAERAMVLTGEYLFDAFWLRSNRDRVYDWHVQGSGRIRGAEGAPWSASADLAEGKFWAPSLTQGKKAPDPVNVRRRDAGDGAWAETLGFGDAGKEVGVRVAMLPEKGTTLYTFAVPGVNPTNNATLMVRRTAPSTVFAAIHEPFKGGPDGHKVVRFDRLAQAEDVVAVAVVGREGSGIDDRVLLRCGDDAEKATTVSGGGESFNFSDCVFVRVSKDTVVAEGPIQAMRIKVNGSPKLLVNGKETPATVNAGFMELKPQA